MSKPDLVPLRALLSEVSESLFRMRMDLVAGHWVLQYTQDTGCYRD